MRVLVCVKRVPAPGARIVLTEDEQAIETQMLGFTISPHEECAVEEAVQINEAHGGTTTVLTLGPAEAEEQLRAALAVGASEAVLLSTEVDDWDPIATSGAITDAIVELEAADGAFDLILFGNESADSGGYQVGVRVATSLGRPCLNGIKDIAIADGQLTGRRETAAGAEIYEVAVPAVVGVKEGINLPRYPTLKGRLGAKKLPVEIRQPDHNAGSQRKLRLVSPPQQVSETHILGNDATAASAVVDMLEELGVL